ncbi:hypothetical protein N7448_008410 [Penicillium atrosanguineum]|uniref:CFEM domain-containing protein n=1 Tax=Penicillium atrosanguineum TaxID=1132637 RepID=A0A9W9UBY4_9EURO|nr:hypothetical protein N7448_008410 [Penicillium atrosanguineum]KAJ5330861.1 hypothetical protein N7476_000644 [Penicillium atrosanguineum]
MKAVTLPLLFSAVALAHPQGLWWGTDFCYPSPENTDNQCSESQESGFDWSDLANGDNWTFEGFNFVGVSAQDNCGGSGGKCIQGKLSRDDGYAISVDSVDAPFSVRTFHLSTSRDTTILVNYELADGSHCRQVAFSSPEGVDVTNEQCGGAVSVQFALPEDSKFGECDLNIHSMDFDCSSGPKPPPTATPSHTMEPSTSMTVPTTHTHWSSSMTPATTETPMTTKTIMTTEEPMTTETPMITSTVYTTHVFTVTQCPASVTDCPSHSTQVKTSTWSLSTTVCPSPTETVTITTSPVISTTAKPTASVVPAPCPEVVPKCLNTWLSIPKCDSNSDTACFCPSSEFADKVKSCIHSWSSSSSEEESSLAYFAGICASYVPKNPAIVDLPPTTSPAVSVPMSTPTPTPTPTKGTVTLAPETTPCTTITWSSHTVTVPQVAFSTVTVSSTTSVCLIPGTTAPATTTSPHTTHISTMTTSCKPTTSTSTTTVPMPTTPTPTTVLSNAGSKTFVSSMWAGMAMLVLGFL